MEIAWKSSPVPGSPLDSFGLFIYLFISKKPLCSSDNRKTAFSGSSELFVCMMQIRAVKENDG